MESNAPTHEQVQRQQLKADRKEYWESYYMKNRERILARNTAYAKGYQMANREEIRECKKDYYQSKAEEFREKHMERCWNFKKTQPNKFEPVLVSTRLYVTLSFD